jgi:hypothetical protein
MTNFVYMHKAFKPSKIGKIWHWRQNVKGKPVNAGRKEDTNQQTKKERNKNKQTNKQTKI